MPGGYVHPDFRDVARAFHGMFRDRGDGGGAVAAYHRGELVLDLWAGSADSVGGRPWRADTMAMSFSTTKGVVSTVVHRLADRGLIDYDRRVVDDWPSFGGDGRDAITVRQLLSHQAGLHRIRGLVDHADELLDHTAVRKVVAGQRPSPVPGTRSGYHGLTFGWLVAGLLEQITGSSMADLVQRELAEPLELDGCYIGAPIEERGRVAELFPRPPRAMGLARLARLAERSKRTRGIAEALLVDGFEELWFEPEQRILDAEMPAANGVFTARSLAKVYAALADGGEVDGVRVLSPETLREAGRIQTRQRDYVLGLPMRWRLGYHQAFTIGRPAWKAFGHFGYGGSGGWADPETGLSFAFVTNRLGSTTTPIGDLRLVRLGGVALSTAREREPSLRS